MTAPFNVLKLPNGWTLEEYESVTGVYVRENCLAPGFGRYLARFHRVPSTKTVRIGHFVGSSAEERQWIVQVGVCIARGGFRNLPWKRRREVNSRSWRFTVSFGRRINVATEFERLRRGLMTDEAIELEFQSIVQQIEVNA